MEQNEKIRKRLKKLIEEIIITNEESLNELYSEEEMKSVIKHKNQVAILGTDDYLIDILTKEVEDIVGLYLLRVNLKEKVIWFAFLYNIFYLYYNED